MPRIESSEAPLETPVFTIALNRFTWELIKAARLEMEESIKRKLLFWGEGEDITQLQQEAILATVPIFIQRCVDQLPKGVPFPHFIEVRILGRSIYVALTREALEGVMRSRDADKNDAQAWAARVASGETNIDESTDFIVTSRRERWKEIRAVFARHFNGERLVRQAGYLRNYIEAELNRAAEVGEGVIQLDNRVFRRVIAMAVIAEMAPNFRIQLTPEEIAQGITELEKVEKIMGTIEKGIAGLTRLLLLGVFLKIPVNRLLLRIFPGIRKIMNSFAENAESIIRHSVEGDGGMIDDIKKSPHYNHAELRAAINLGIEASNGSTASTLIRCIIEIYKNPQILIDIANGVITWEEFIQAAGLVEQSVRMTFRQVYKDTNIVRHLLRKGASIFMSLKTAHADHQDRFFQPGGHNIQAIRDLGYMDADAWLIYSGKEKVESEGAPQTTYHRQTERGCIGMKFAIQTIKEILIELYSKYDVTHVELGGRHPVATESELLRVTAVLKES